MTRTSVVDRYGEGKPHVYKVRMTEQQIRDEIFSKQGMQGISTEPKWSTLAETRLLMLMVKYKPVGIHKHNNLGHLHMYMNHIYAFEDGVGCFLYDADHAEYASQLGLPPHLRSGAYTPKYYIRPSVEQIWEKINTWYDLWWAECNEELPQELIKEKTFRLPSSYFMDVRTEPVDESGVAEAVSNLSVRSPDAVRPIPSHNLRRHRKATSRPSCGGWTAEDTRPPLQVSRGFTRKKGKQAIQEQQSKRARSSHGGPKIPFKDVLRGRRSRKLPDQTSPKAEKRSSHRELSESGGQRRLSRSENARASRSGVPAPKSCEPLVKSRSHPERRMLSLATQKSVLTSPLMDWKRPLNLNLSFTILLLVEEMWCLPASGCPSMLLPEMEKVFPSSVQRGSRRKEPSMHRVPRKASPRRVLHTLTAVVLRSCCTALRQSESQKRHKRGGML